MNNQKKFNKIIIVVCILVACLSLLSNFYKSYAIYKIQKKFEIFKQKIDGYTTGDVLIAAIVDGEETNEFPSYETNYKVLSIECTNGATGSFDVENWRVAIDDMSSTSTKCTVSFDSTKTNQVEPINMSKSELIALNEEISSTSARTLANYLYPIGSVYISTEDDTIEKVQNKFGGTWVKYSEGTMLMGVDSNHEINSTGGASSVNLSSSNLPTFSINGTTNSTGSGYTIGYTYSSRSTNTTGAHSHTIVNQNNASQGLVAGTGNGDSGNWSFNDSVNDNYYAAKFIASSNGNHYHTVNDYYANSISGVGAHTHTYTSTYTNNSQASVDIQNPYTAVYMYKRTA